MCIFKKKYKIKQVTESNKNEILNKIYYSSLDFGKNWMRPITDIAYEKYPLLPNQDIISISNYLNKIRAEIFAFIEELYLLKDENLIQKAQEYIILNYEWMNEKNINRSIFQGQYYAWHG